MGGAVGLRRGGNSLLVVLALMLPPHPLISKPQQAEDWPRVFRADNGREISYRFRMNSHEEKTLTRDVEASIVPVGTKVTLQKGGLAHVMQSLGGTYTVIVNGNMFRIDGKDADALGLEIQARPAAAASGPVTQGGIEKLVWDALKTCYDPEIPVNIVDLGLIYDCVITPLAEGSSSYRVNVKMTLTAPGCGMGPMIAQDAQNKILSIEAVDEANVEVVWDPPWNQSMLSEAAKLQLGLM